MLGYHCFYCSHVNLGLYKYIIIIIKKAPIHPLSKETQSFRKNKTKQISFFLNTALYLEQTDQSRFN